MTPILPFVYEEKNIHCPGGGDKEAVTPLKIETLLLPPQIFKE